MKCWQALRRIPLLLSRRFTYGFHTHVAASPQVTLPPIEMGPMRMIAAPSGWMRRNLTGPRIKIRGQVGAEGGFAYRVKLSAGLQLGTNSLGLPLLSLSGNLVSQGTSRCAAKCAQRMTAAGLSPKSSECASSVRTYVWCANTCVVCSSLDAV